MHFRGRTPEPSHSNSFVARFHSHRREVERSGIPGLREPSGCCLRSFRGVCPIPTRTAATYIVIGPNGCTGRETKTVNCPPGSTSEGHASSSSEWRMHGRRQRSAHQNADRGAASEASVPRRMPGSGARSSLSNWPPSQPKRLLPSRRLAVRDLRCFLAASRKSRHAARTLLSH